MTDKQIIINKMDKPKRYCEGIDCAWCNEKEPCIYKIANELEEKLLHKEQDCEELKKQHQSDKGLITSIGKMNYQLLQEYDKLKNCLAEIKEIAEKIDDSDGCAYGDYDCDNCSSLEQETVCTYKVKKLILQKISECEAE